MMKKATLVCSEESNEDSAICPQGGTATLVVRAVATAVRETDAKLKEFVCLADGDNTHAYVLGYN